MLERSSLALVVERLSTRIPPTPTLPRKGGGSLLGLKSGGDAPANFLVADRFPLGIGQQSPPGGDGGWGDQRLSRLEVDFIPDDGDDEFSPRPDRASFADRLGKQNLAFAGYFDGFHGSTPSH